MRRERGRKRYFEEKKSDVHLTLPFGLVLADVKLTGRNMYSEEDISVHFI